MHVFTKMMLLCLFDCKYCFFQLMQSEVADFITIYRNKYELKFLQLSEVCSEPSHESKIELSAKIVNDFQIYIMKLI